LDISGDGRPGPSWVQEIFEFAQWHRRASSAEIVDAAASLLIARVPVLMVNI
jgi:hypothetical protein